MSVRARVTLASVIVLGIGLAILSVALNLVLANRLSADASTVLANRAEAQVATLVYSGGTLHERKAPNDAELDDQGWIFGAAGTLIEGSPAGPKLRAVVDELGRVEQPTERNVDDHLRLRGQPVRGPDGARVGGVVVGVSLQPYRHTLRLAIAGTVVLDGFVILGGALVARRAVGAALRPVAEMTERAAEWSETDLHRRFALGPPRDELTALAATLDGMLGRLDAALRHEQRFSAEMAHELRTPLTTVRGEAELALRPGREERELRDALAQVLAGTDRMAAVIETLVAAARGEAASARGSADAVAVARTLTRLATPAAAAHARTIELAASGEPLPVGAAHDVVAGALQPLLDNALRHARHAVTVRVGRENGHVVIAVRDDGDGVPAGAAERVFEPGVSDAGGAGLGLPLARRLARAAGGDVLCFEQPGGRFELHLPGLDSRQKSE